MAEVQQCAAGLKDYGLLLVAVIGVCITWGQWVTARNKLILDLYNMRRAVYSKFSGPIGQALREGRSDTENFFDYLRVADEARFLFGRDVLDYAEKLRLTLIKMGEATSMLGGDGMHLSDEDRRRYDRVRHDCMIELSDIWKRLDALMVPYMLMEQKRPWSLSRFIGWIEHRWRARRTPQNK